MSDANNTFGFELFQKLYDDEIRKKEDIIILFVHWYLTKYGFRCIGLAEGDDFNALDKGSELLPKEWNLRPSYALRYIKDGKVYVFLGIKSDTDLLLNLLKHDDNSISNAHFPIEGTVSALHGPLETVIPAYQTVLYVIRKDFVDPIYSGNTKDTTTQTSNNESATHNEPYPAPFRDPLLLGRRTGGFDLPIVGGRDLDPFGHGGMIFDPFQRAPGRRAPAGLGVPGRLPPGAIPPGARFDPFGPPEADDILRHRRRPDDDHLPPPGFNDMFQ